MLKRIIALFLVCILAIPIFAVPASASTTTGPMLTGEHDLQIYLLLSDLWEYFTVINENHWMVKLRQMLEDVLDVFWSDTKYAISVLVAEYMPRIDNSLDAIYGKLDAFKTEVVANFTSTISKLTELNSLVTVVSSRVKDGFDNLNTWILDQTTALMQGFRELYLNIIDHKNVMVDWFTEVRDEIVDTRQSILNYLAELFSGEDAGDPDDFNSDVDQQETEFQEMVDTMETAPTVNVDDINSALGNLNPLKDSQTDAFYMAIISQMISLEFLAPIYFLLGLLCLLGYLLYGKR